MSDPIRLKAMKALTDIIETAELPDGMTLSGRVIRGRLTYGPGDPLPMVSLLEPPHAIENLKGPSDFTGRAGDWDILVQGWVKDNKKYPTDECYILQAAVCQRIAEHKRAVGSARVNNLLGLNGKCTDISLGAPVIRPPDDTSDRSCFYMIVTLKIVEDLINPFV